MIKVNELRIGNWVKLGDINGKVKSIYSSHFQVDDERSVSLGNSLQINFKPIPLTEEILLKCGFEKVITKGDFDAGFDDEVTYGLEYKREFYLSYCDDFSVGIFSSKKASNDELGICIPIESARYLHQLQNLFFTLTGEELEIKL
jgi:hypothetical protein